MTTVAASTFLAFVFAALVVGFLAGAAFRRARHERLVRRFGEYRAAMLDDWRAASDKVTRMRAMIRRCQSVREVRDALRQDDQEHPPIPIGIAVYRGNRERRR